MGKIVIVEVTQAGETWSADKSASCSFQAGTRYVVDLETAEELRASGAGFVDDASKPELDALAETPADELVSKAQFGIEIAAAKRARRPTQQPSV